MKQRKSKQVRLFSGMLIGIVMIAVLARIVYLNLAIHPQRSSHIQKMTLLSLEIMR